MTANNNDIFEFKNLLEKQWEDIKKYQLYSDLLELFELENFGTKQTLESNLQLKNTVCKILNAKTLTERIAEKSNNKHYKIQKMESHFI